MNDLTQMVNFPTRILYCDSHSPAAQPSFKFCWMWIFPLVKLSLPSCSMWEKIRWLNWFWQFLFEGLSSFHVEGFYYSYVWSCSLCEGRASFCVELISRKLYVFLVMLLTSFSSLCLTSFSIDPLLHLYTRFFILFHLTLMTFCQSTHLAMCLVDFNSNLFWWNW